MKFSDETLMAYADGELEPALRAQIEAAIASDPEVARAVLRHRALAARVRAAYEGVLAEPVPERLAALAADPEPAPVADLPVRRAARQIAIGPVRLPAWAAMAASVLVGLTVGVMLARGPAPAYEETASGLVARGALDESLTAKLAAAPDDSGVSIGISFRDRSGDFCRTFELRREASVAGLACRRGDDWRLEVLAAAPAPAGELRPAAAMPAAVLRAVDAAIEGEPLDAAAEAAARDAGWRPARGGAAP